MTTSRITSGEESKYRNGLVDLAMAGHVAEAGERVLKFALTVPPELAERTDTECAECERPMG